MDFSTFSDMEVLDAYSSAIDELFKRNIIRTNNMTGELGEYLVVDYYNKMPELPNLILCDVGADHYDAKDVNGKTYSIKTTTNTTTGTFTGLQPKGSEEQDQKLFDYAIVCKLNGKTFKLEHIYQIEWDDFLSMKGWHSTMKAWNISLTKKNISKTKIIL